MDVFSSVNAKRKWMKATDSHVYHLTHVLLQNINECYKTIYSAIKLYMI